MSKLMKTLIAYMTVLSIFTVYVLMDTFVITRVYGEAATEVSNDSFSEEDEDALETAEKEVAVSSESANSDKEAVSSENSYEDENISVNISEFRVNDTTVYAADVRLSSPEYLKTALAQGVYGKNVKENTSEMAENANAVLAVNGDYYGAREAGFVIKNGTLYRNTSAGRDDLVIYSDGSWEIVNEDEVSAEELIEKGAVQTMSFGPALVQSGSIAVGENEEVRQSMSSNPRTAIGIIDDCHYVFVVSDGRTDESAGLSLYSAARQRTTSTEEDRPRCISTEKS